MILLIDNYDSFTWNLVQRIGELDPAIDLRVVRNDRITPDEAMAMAPSHVIISPGPCSPTEAGVSNEIVARFAGRAPLLGVCLGHQCIGQMHGMTVARAPRVMHGKTSLIHHDGRGIYAGLPNPFEATRYHSLIVTRESVPQRGWEVSAWTVEEDAASTEGKREIVMGLRRVWEPRSQNSRLNGPDMPAPGGASTPGATRAPGGMPTALRGHAENGESHVAPLDGVQFHPESFLTPDGPRLLANFLNLERAGMVSP